MKFYVKTAILISTLIASASALAVEKSNTTSKVLLVREAQNLMSQEYGPTRVLVYADGAVRLFTCPKNSKSKCDLMSKGQMTPALLSDYKRLVHLTLKSEEEQRPEKDYKCKALPRERVQYFALGTLVADIYWPCGKEYSKNKYSSQLETLLDGLFESLDQDPDGNDR